MTQIQKGQNIHFYKGDEYVGSWVVGCNLIVTDCFGKKFPCQYAGISGKQALIQINGHKMATDIANLKKTY